MAIYHLSVKNGSPGAGAPHADYIEREGKYADRAEDLEYSESGNMPAWAAHDHKVFWRSADAYERENGRPYKEIEISLPRELDHEQRIELVREFVQSVIGDRHAYTWAIHNPHASDGCEQPHAHIMFTERAYDGIERDPEQFFSRHNSSHPERGGAKKDRYFNGRQFVRDVRQEWAITANHYLERYGIEARIDHRSYKDIGNGLEPSLKEGNARKREEWKEQYVAGEITKENRERMERNGERIIARPEIAIDELTRTKSVFSRRDVEHYLFANTDGAQQYQEAYAKVMQSPELVGLKHPGREGDWYTSRELREIETRLIARAQAMAREGGYAVDDKAREAARASRQFNEGQKAAYDVLTNDAQIATVNGAAGTGKSYVMAAAREAFERDGFKVLGAALQGKTADDMQRDAGIDSRTLHSLLSQLDQGQVPLDRKTVIVIDEAGMVGSRQMEKLLAHAEQAGAKVRLIGDAWQLHAVDAGDAFKYVARETQTASLTEIMRQGSHVRGDPEQFEAWRWQREASEKLARHEIAEGLAAYQERGFVRETATQADARAALLAQWSADRQAAPQRSQIILAHTNSERQELNRLVRDIRRQAGEIGQDKIVRAEGRLIRLAEGDRIMFGRNEYVMNVKNGTLGTVDKIEGDRLAVRLDDGRQVQVDTRAYGWFDHGYALTVHKAQGVTVDRAYVLATNTMSAELAYVGLTRHRENLQVHFSREQFREGAAELARVLSRAEDKGFSAAHELDARPRVETGKRRTLAQARGDARGAAARFAAKVQAKAGQVSTTLAQQRAEREALEQAKRQAEPSAPERREHTKTRDRDRGLER
ncbi:MAG: Ti-type conjugative transfer relaxase TraA [Zavarzinia sp.]|nr:Ti-type conjugative transfer relaxase TraA [Zavarzinia sp.]